MDNVQSVITIIIFLYNLSVFMVLHATYSPYLIHHLFVFLKLQLILI